MSESSQLIYPTINLFLYDLREGLGKANEIATNRQKFRDKISPDVDPQLKDLASKENLEADNVRLAEKNFSDQDGYYLARQIGDSYTLQINCSGESAKETPDSPNQPKTPQSIQKLADIKKSIVDHINHHNKSKEIEPNKQGTIGQTWLVWGQLLNGQDGEQVARQCYQQLNPDSKSKPDFKEHGKWLEDAQVFEYWHLPNNWLQVQKPEASKEVQDLSQKWQSFSQENYHLIILLFPADKSFDRITSILKQNYVNFTYLFLYRHKISYIPHSPTLLEKSMQTPSSTLCWIICSTYSKPRGAPAVHSTTASANAACSLLDSDATNGNAGDPSSLSVDWFITTST